MKHTLSIGLTKQPMEEVVRVNRRSLREKLLTLLFGRKVRLTIIIPGETVESLNIKELEAAK